MADPMALRTPADLVVAGTLLAAIAVSLVQIWGGAGARATHAIVYIGDTAHAELPLDQPARLSVPGRLGNSVIEVADGAVHFVESPCSHKLCLRAGQLRHAHEAAACVPNRVSIALRGGQSDYDGVNH